MIGQIISGIVPIPFIVRMMGGEITIIIILLKLVIVPRLSLSIMMIYQI